MPCLRSRIGSKSSSTRRCSRTRPVAGGLAGLDGHRLAVACCGYVAVLAIGLLGGPVRPGDLLPWVAPQADGARAGHDPESAPGASARTHVNRTGDPGSQVSGSGPASPGAVGAATSPVVGFRAPVHRRRRPVAATRGRRGRPHLGGRRGSTGRRPDRRRAHPRRPGRRRRGLSTTDRPRCPRHRRCRPRRCPRHRPCRLRRPRRCRPRAHPDRAGATRRPGGRAHAGRPRSRSA